MGYYPVVNRFKKISGGKKMKNISRFIGYAMVLLLLVSVMPVFARGSAAPSASSGALPDLDTSRPVEVIMY
jgi:hypothetical protein